MRYAWALERIWSKDEILEAYLNLAITRGELAGVAALSRGLFAKAPHGLDSREAAVLTDLLREPMALPARAAARAAAILRRQSLPANDRELLAAATAALLRPPPLAPEADAAPEVARRLLQPLAKPGSGRRSLRAYTDPKPEPATHRSQNSRLSMRAGAG
jgi:penicillin-binding protein 1C